MTKQKNKILVVGQVPPPYGGQAASIKRMLEANYQDIEFLHLNLSAAKSMGELGKFNVRKALFAVNVLSKMVSYRIWHGVKVMYYPPAIQNMASTLRDIFLLLPGRKLFPKVIFHFHAGGFRENYQRYPFFIRRLLQWACFVPDVAIVKSDYSKDEIVDLHPKKVFLVPNGLPDYARGFDLIRNNPTPILLYVGALYETKGVFDLLETAGMLKQRGLSFKLRMVGEGDQQTLKRIFAYMDRLNIQAEVELCGVLSGEAKWRAYAEADVFCFPSHLENLPLAIIEAMMFGLPIISTWCGGIPELVIDGENGFLVPLKDILGLVEKISLLIGDRGLRIKMGKASRKHYLTNFTLEKERELLHQALISAFEEG